MASIRNFGLTRKMREERGSELIEFALVCPLLLMVVLAIVDFGFLFQRYEVVTNAAREGVRVAVLPGYSGADVQTRVETYAADSGLQLTPSVATTDTTFTDGTTTWPSKTVAVTYPHQYIFLGGIASWFGGSFTTVTLTAGATMRTELSP